MATLPKAASLHLRKSLSVPQVHTCCRAHLLYDSVSFSSISDAFLVEFSMACMRDAFSLQLFSDMALKSICTSAQDGHQCTAGVARQAAKIQVRILAICRQQAAARCSEQLIQQQVSKQMAGSLRWQAGTLRGPAEILLCLALQFHICPGPRQPQQTFPMPTCPHLLKMSCTHCSVPTAGVGTAICTPFR